MAETIETTRSFKPKFGADGLIPAIVTDRRVVRTDRGETPA